MKAAKKDGSRNDRKALKKLKLKHNSFVHKAWKGSLTSLKGKLALITAKPEEE